MRLHLATCAALLSASVSCHKVIGHGDPTGVDRGGVDGSTRDAPAPDLRRDAPRRDRAVPTVDASPVDARAPDTRSPDTRSPDTRPPDTRPPDAWPTLSPSSCTSLWLDAPVIPVSAAGGAPAGRPAVVQAGGSFYVAFAEGGSVNVQRIDLDGKKGLAQLGALANTQPVPVTAGVTAGGSVMGVAWRSTTSCPSTTQLAELALPPGAATGAQTASPGGCTSGYGYGAPALARTGSHYLVAAPVENSCSLTHHKHWLGLAGLAASTGCYNAPGQGATTFNVALEPLVPNRYALAHLHQPERTSDPYKLYLYSLTATASSAFPSSGSWGSWSTGPLPTPRERRPALAWDGAQLWVGYQNDTKLGVRRCPHTGTTAQPCATEQAYAPANVGPTTARLYAHPAIVHSVAHGATLMAYSVAATPNVVGATFLAQSNKLVTAPTEVVVRSPAASPRFTTIARHPLGFGIAWVEESASVDEVYFKFVGCL